MGLNLLFDALFQWFCVTHDAEKSAHRQVLVNQCLGLIALELGRVFRVTLEVPAL